jgi:hypothetical protein
VLRRRVVKGLAYILIANGEGRRDCREETMTLQLREMQTALWKFPVSLITLDHLDNLGRSWEWLVGCQDGCAILRLVR